MIGESIAKGVCAYFNVPYIESAAEQEGETIYRVQVGAFRDPENAGNMQEELKKAGFDGFIVKGKL